MKKLLTATLAIAMGATIVGAVAGCNTNKPTDEEKAEKAISIIRALYRNSNEETPSDYTVVGKVQVDGSIYDVDWTVTPAATCTVENFSSYVSLGELNTETDLYTVSISNAEVKIEYTLQASVTVGKAVKTIEFNHSVPAGRVITGETIKALLTVGADTRTTITDDQQVFTKDGLTITNDKYNSSTKPNPSYPTRFYKGSKVTIEYPGMMQLKISTDKAYENGTKVDDYPNWLKNSLEAAAWDGVTVTLDDENLMVTVDFETAVDSFVFEASFGQLRIKEVSVTGKTGGATAQDKVNVAKLMLALDTNEYSATGTYALPAAVNGTTVTWTVKEASEYVSISNNGKLVVGKMPTAETSVVLVANISIGTEATTTKEITVKLIPIAGVTHAGTQADPYLPSEAIIVANRLESGETSAATYYVKGYVVKCTDYLSNYGNFDAIYIVDTYAADKDEKSPDALYIYRPRPDGTYLTTAGLTKGDEVVFCGNLQNYKGNTPELINGTCVAKTAAVDERTDAQKAQAALDAAVQKLNGSEVTGNITLTSSVAGVTLSITNSTNTDAIALNGTVTRLATDTEVTLTLQATCGTEKPTQTVTVTVKAEANLTGDGTLEHPYTVADVNELLRGVGDSTSSTYYTENDTPVLVHVKGYVVVSGSWSSNNSNYTGVYIVDEYAANKNASSEDALQVYGLQSGVADLTLDATHSLQKGEYIILTGYLQNRYGAYQVTYNSGTNPTVVQYEGVSNANKIVNAIAALEEIVITEANAEGVALPESTVDGVTFTWSTEDTTYTVSGNKITVATLPSEDTEVTLTLTVNCGDVTETKSVTIVVAKSGTQKEIVLNKLSFETTNATSDTSVSNYGTTWTAKRGDYTYTISNFNNNQKGWEFIKTGHKTNVVVGTITTGPISNTITKVVVDIQKLAANADVDNVNSFKLEVATAADFNGDSIVCTVTKTIAAGANTFDVTGTTPGTQYYYRITIDCAAGSANGYVWLDAVTFYGHEATEANKVADALAGVKDTLEDVTEAGEVALPASTVAGVTFTWSTENTTYTVTDNKLNVTALPTEEVVVTLKVSANIGDVTEEKTVTITIKPEGQAPLGTLANPYTVADVKEILKDVASGGYYSEDSTPKLVHVKGYVVASGTWSDKNSNYTGVYIVDEYAANKNASSEDALQVYGLQSGVEGLTLDATHALQKGEYIIVTGYINNYSGKGQISYNSGTNPTVVQYEGVSDAIKVENALAALEEIVITEANAEGVALPESTVDGVTFTWSTEDTTYTVSGNKITVATLPSEDTEVTLTLTVNCGDVTETKSVTAIIAKSGTKKEVTLYTLTTNTKGKNSGYAGNEDMTVDSHTWNVEGNVTMDPWRLGGKSLSGTDRSITGKTAISGTVTKLAISFGTADTATVNSVTLKVYGSDGAVVSTKTVNYTKGGTVTVEADEDWTNCTYQLVFNLNTGSSNQFASVTSIAFTGYAA